MEASQMSLPWDPDRRSQFLFPMSMHISLKADKSHDRSHTNHVKANTEKMVSTKIVWWRKMGKGNVTPHNQDLCILAND